MKYIITFFSLFWFAQWRHAQNKLFTNLRDYLVPASRLDSL